VVFNTFSKGLVILDGTELSILNNSHQEVGNKDFLEQLKTNGFLIDDDFDELNFLKYFHYKTKFSHSQLSLTIAPTLDCNFACPYCYENARKGSMSSEVQEKLVAFINEKVISGVRKIDVVWYGGEPLLFPEIIDHLASRFNEISEQNCIDITMSLVTNGYLLTNEIVEMLEHNKINNIQITLDGLEQNHDQRRYLKNKKGTFSKIFENLKLFRGTNIRINIRMNVDHINSVDYPNLKKLIDGIEDVKIGIYPSAVENLNERKSERKEYYMSSSEYEGFIINNYLDDTICDGGLEVSDNRRYFCAAELDNSYVVDEQGNFYKCWDEIGNTACICFNVLDPNQVNYNPIIRYLSDDSFSSAKCCDCVFLPLCFGGCRYQKTNLNKSVCNFSEDTLRTFIEAKYLK
jgi:uncharacterized protein